MDDARKPIVIAIVVAVVVVLAFAAGVALGGGGESSGSQGWQERLEGIGRPASDLTPEDVTLGSGCTLDEGELGFAGRCSIAVAERGGGPSLSSPVRRAHLRNLGTARVGLELEVEGETIEASLEPADDENDDDETDLTFGPAGGGVDLTCPFGSQCRVALG